MSEPKELASDKGTVTFLVITLIISAIGVGIIFPVMPALVMDLTGQDVAGAAVWGGIASFVFALMQFFFSPIIGGLSDRFGRRPVLLASLAALSLDYMLMGLAHALWIFFIARIISGIFSATTSTANAYIADITPEEDRARRFGYIGAAFGIGFILGPAIGGFLGQISPRAPFFAASFCAGANALYGYFFIPESLRKENRRPFDWKASNPYGTLMKLGATRETGTLAGVYFLTALSNFVLPTVWAYVAIEKFGWSEVLIGWSITYYGLIFVVSQAVVTPYVLPRLGERRAIWIGSLVQSIALVGIATAPNGLSLYIWMSASFFTGIQTPALQKLMTSRVPKDRQGELQGGLSALSSLVILTTPLLYTQIFFLFTRGGLGFTMAGAPFLMASAFNFLAFILFLTRRRQSTTPS